LRLTRLKNDLLATVSHELKTPLASMRLLVDTLLETGIHDSQRVREYLQLIAKENVRLSRLVDNFLTFSRMEQNRQSFERKQVPPGTVVEAAAASVADRFRASGCRFEVQNTPDLPALSADHDALVTVLLNLLDNAYKYSDEDKHIVLRSYLENGNVCFAVQDNGIGLSSRVAGRIFERFYQVDQTLTRPGSGCGLGLSIVKFIVSAHGGSVDVDSRPGEGSTFTVRFPVAPAEQAAFEEPLDA
jgi:signal transduction histidine kinase